MRGSGNVSDPPADGTRLSSMEHSVLVSVHLYLHLHVIHSTGPRERFPEDDERMKGANKCMEEINK